MMPSSHHYGAILADPPWSFKTYSAKGEGRSAVQHYNTMDLEAIKALPVSQWAAPDCALFMWITFPTLPQALDVMRAWGFEFKTVAFLWTKTNKRHDGGPAARGDFFMGLGYWTRANGEACLLGTRGKPTRLARDVRQLIVSPVREHSRKPDEVRGRIQRLVPGPYLEMFARQRAPGWDAWGNEVDRFEPICVAEGVA